MPLRNLRRCASNVVRSALADLDVALGLQEAKFVEDLEADVGTTSLDPSVPSAFSPARFIFVKSLYVPLSAAVTPTLGGAGVLLTLIQRQERSSFCRFPVQGTFLHVLFIEGCEVLVKVSRAHCVPSVKFCYGAKVYEPVHLDSFPEVSWRICGYPSAGIGYLEKLCPAFWIALAGRHLFSKLRVSFSKDDDRVA